MAQNTRARYGVDAPGVFFGLAASAAGVPVVTAAAFAGHWSTRWPLLVGSVYAIASYVSYAYTTLRGKFAVWSEELDALGLSGTERVADLGCGRGAVLVLVAQRLTTGTVTGVDLWRSADQSGNSETATRRNAEAEDVSGRVELVTGDLRELPLPDASADLVVSSLVIHNIVAASDRVTAITHAYRILAPGGRLRIADFRHTREYAEALKRLGAQDVAVRSLGWRYWYGAPWFGTSMLTATKPAP